MKNILLILTFLLLSTATPAQPKKSLGSHEHGSIKLELAASEKILEVDPLGPAESFFGFEHLPVTSKEKKTFEDAKALWTQDLLTKLFVLDQKLGCLVTEVKFEQVIETKNHEDHHKGVSEEILPKD